MTAKLRDHHARELAETGKISSPDFLTCGETDILGLPENPFDYAALLARGAIGRVPKAREGTRVAIVGAGAAGLCAAYELMKVGLVPVLYEVSGRTGGRIRSVGETTEPAVVLEHGAMRIPKSSETVQFYLKDFGVRTASFPNPGTVDTMISFENHQEVWKKGSPDPPDVLRPVLGKLMSFFGPKVADVLTGPPEDLPDRWRFWVERYRNLGFLDALCNENRWTSRELALIGAIGFGLGGLDAQFRVCVLELLRASLDAAKTAQQPDDMVLGNVFGNGASCITDTFWQRAAKTPDGMRNVSALQDAPGQWRPGVRAIRATPARKGVEIEDAAGHCETFEATIVTCTPRALQLGIHVDPALLSTRVTRAIRGIHYVNASKLMCFSDEKFWVNEGIPQVTLTDRMPRASYLIDFGPQTKQGACLLSYTWGDDSTKLLALSDKEIQQVCLRALDEIHAGRISAQKLHGFQVVHWELESGYNGGFKLTYPGQYEQNVALFNQCRESLSAKSSDGLFLAGEGVSWVGGFIEGALHSAINAACSTIELLGGTVGES